MNNKGFEAEILLKETPNFEVTDEKPLNERDNKSRKVDINVLKARAQQIQNKENRKNVYIFIFFVALLGSIGTFLSIWKLFVNYQL